MACEICGRSSCTKSFHSNEEQDSFDDVSDKTKNTMTETYFDLKNALLTRATELAEKMYEECDDDCVGEEREDVFEYEGVKYYMTISAFWEGINHFDLSVKSLDGFEYHKIAVEF